MPGTCSTVGMELHELEIADTGAGTPRHGEAIAGRNCRVRGLAKHPARPRRWPAARRGPRRARRCRRGAATRPRRNGRLRRPGVSRARDRTPAAIATARRAPRACGQSRGRWHPARAAHGGPSARLRVPAPVCRQDAAIERDAPVQQFGDVARPFGDEHVNGLGIAEPGARIERVGQVQRRRVVAAHRCGNATLCVAGVALGAAGLREEQHVSASDQIGRRPKAGDPAADDHVVGAYVHPVLS